MSPSVPAPPASRVVLVTGSGKRRVGNVISRELAADGWSVAVHYHTSRREAEATVAEINAAGGRAAAFSADVGDETDVRRLVDQTIDNFGRIDALVCAAAIWESKPLEDVTADDVRRHFEINALGTFLCCREAGLRMVTEPAGGSIVTMGDWAVARPYRNYAAYFPSKGAIPALTRSLAVELAARNPNIRVNCVLPGPVMLPADLPAAEREEAIAGTLVQREGRPEDVAHAVKFLLENPFVTGVCLPVDGGRTVYNAESRRPTE
jgi:pteridine reductase